MKDLVDVGHRHYTLAREHPLFRSLCHAIPCFQSSLSGQKRLYDVSSITENPQLFDAIISCLASKYKAMGNDGPTHIIGVETCGCFLAAPLALRLGVPFIFARREKLSENSFVTDGADKLPNPPMSVRNNSIDSKSRVVVVDDFIDTGKTMDAVLDCIEVVKASVIEIVAVCDTTEGGGIEYIRKESPIKDLNIFTLFRLRNSLEVLYPPKKYRSQL